MNTLDKLDASLLKLTRQVWATTTGSERTRLVDILSTVSRSLECLRLEIGALPLSESYPNPGEKTLRDELVLEGAKALIASDAFHGPIYQQEPVAAVEFGKSFADAFLAAKMGCMPPGQSQKDLIQLLSGALEQALKAAVAWYDDGTGCSPEGLPWYEDAVVAIDAARKENLRRRALGIR